MKKHLRKLQFRGEPQAFASICRMSKRPKEALDALKQMGVEDVSLENRLEVRADGAETEILLIGAIGKSWWDDSGITEQEVRDALKSIPNGRPITVKVNSEGGSVKEGLGIYNAFKDRSSDITCKITGYALSIASVFPLGAAKVVSPKSAIWMIHKAWNWAQGNADEMRRTADMLDVHDQTMAGIYAEHTGKPESEILTAMENETWIKGADAVAWGLADESDPDESAAAAYRPLHPDYISRCKNLSSEILNTISALPRQGEQKPTPTMAALAASNQDKHMRTKMEALLKSWQVKFNAEMTDDAIFALVEKGKPTTAPATAAADKSPTELDEIRAELRAQKTQRIQDKLDAEIDAQRITKSEAKIFLAQALVNAEQEEAVFAAIAERQPVVAGGQAAGAHIITIEDSPCISANGVQGSKILPELENIFSAHKAPSSATPEQSLTTTRARYEAMKAEWPRLLKLAARKDNGVQASNTFTGTFTTNFLILGVILKLHNRFAPAKLFTMDSEQDPYKPLAAGIRKFNATTTDGTKVGQGVTNFETLAGASAGNDDSDVEPITITPLQYTSGGHVTNAELNSGLRVADIIEAKLIDLAAKITQVFTAPLTVANIVTNAPLVSAPAAFGFSELADLQGTLKKSNVKNLLLDGEYLARIANTPGFFQTAGTVGGDAGAWSKFGWDNIALNTDWSGAGANVRGCALAPSVIGIISGLPLNPPEGIPGNIVQMGSAQLPDVQKAIATYVWFSAQARTLFFTFDMIAGATLIDETAGRLIKSA